MPSHETRRAKRAIDPLGLAAEAAKWLGSEAIKGVVGKGAEQLGRAAWDKFQASSIVRSVRSRKIPPKGDFTDEEREECLDQLVS